MSLTDFTQLAAEVNFVSFGRFRHMVRNQILTVFWLCATCCHCCSRLSQSPNISCPLKNITLNPFTPSDSVNFASTLATQLSSKTIESLQNGFQMRFREISLLSMRAVSIGGSRGHQGRAPSLGPISFIFMQFSVKIWLNNRLTPPPWGLTPPYGKSWIRHCYRQHHWSLEATLTITFDVNGPLRVSIVHKSNEDLILSKLQSLKNR